MDVNNLSVDELRGLTPDELKQLVDDKLTVRTFDVDGLTVTVDTELCKSWKAFRIMSKLNGELSAESLQIMIDFVELVSDVDEETIVNHCGGDNASLESVVNTISKIISECFPKK